MSEEFYGRVRSWLLKQPRPDAVRVISLDGQEHEVQCGRRWADTARAILTLEPAVLHALGPGGEVLRGERLVEGVEDEPESRHEIGIPAVLSKDPETARLTHFANLLERAHEKSAEFIADFGKILIERTDRLEDSLQAAREEARMEFRERMRAEMEGMQDGEGKDELIRHFFTGRAQGQQEQANNGNGRSPMKGWGGD